MATLDDGVRNLERFIGYLALATGELERIGRGLGGSEKDLAQLEDEAGEQGTGLNDRLEELQSALEAAQEDATEAIAGIRDAGSDAEDEVGEAHGGLEDAAAGVEDRAQQVQDGIEEAHASVAEEGFDALGRVLHDARRGVEAAHVDAQQATADLLAAVEGFDAETAAVWQDAEHAADQAISACERLESSLEAAQNDAVATVETEAGTIENACASLSDELTTIYENVAQAAGVERQEMAGAMASAAESATNRVTAGEEDRLEQPAQAVEDRALSPLSAELSRLGCALASAAAMMESLPPLTADLGKCQAVVGKIDELLQAMAG